MSDASPIATPATSVVESKASPRTPILQSSSPSSLRTQSRPQATPQDKLPFLPSADKELTSHWTRPATPVHPVQQVLALDRPVLPEPIDTSKCPLFCCFYAEFDNIVGPKVCFQSPKHFMDHDIGIATEHVHEILANTFHEIQEEHSNEESDSQQEGDGKGGIAREDKETEDGQDQVTRSSAAKPQEVSSSIFDTTSEYIITGNELAGKMICLSTHRIHIITRPTVISNERYERNSLLFCVGFVLRREDDPRPFRPLLAKLAVTLRSMEVESQFLTKSTLRPQLQPLLERLLVSLNSRKRECNLLLDSANPLNLKLFRPPKQPASPVPDYKVPVLLRTDCFQMHDWDLAINWIVLHIDSVKHARWISTKSEVDMEMVRACLRVLKHHRVIALVDMFFYSNRYECTDRAAAMLAGKEPKLLNAAFEFVSRSRQLRGGIGDSTHSGGCNTVLSTATNQERQLSPMSSFSSSFPPLSSSLLLRGSSPRVGSATAPQEVHIRGALRRKHKKLKAALAELYCSCNRKTSFGDLWLAKVAQASHTALVPQSLKNRESIATDNVDDATLTTKPSRARTGQSLPESQGSLSGYHQSSAAGEAMSPQTTVKTRNMSNTIDWKEAFQSFDHRRFATFGIVHGLLRRVHNFPNVCDAPSTSTWPTEEPVLPESFKLQGETIRATSFRNEPAKKVQDDVTQANRGTFRTTALPKEDLYGLVQQIVSKMDGTRCDDELVCMFEKPLEELLDLAKTVGNKRVFSMFSTTDAE